MVESAEETIKRIFGDSGSSLGSELADVASRYHALEGVEYPHPARTRFIAVANQKGGVGKTSSTVNLAAAMAIGGLRVLVIDMDPQGNASTAFNIPHLSGDLSVYDVIEGRKTISEVKQTCPDIQGVDVVPASIDLSGAELELADMDDRNNLLKNAVNEFLNNSEEHYDYVFIDCPPSLGLLVINAMCAAQEMLIPIQAEYYALEGLGQLIRTIGLVQKHYNPILVVSTMLVTMFDKRTLLGREVYQEVKNHYPNIVLNTTIPRTVKISEAPSFAQSVITYDSRGTGAVSYREAALEIARRSETVLSVIAAKEEENNKR
ncbi:ParA family protein [Gardnerella vaginalis]|uniref:Chromosome partitioning protein n=1 Tax=Gardnerella vaginalis TaxID=2702 RepID=A0A2K1SV36_GARVA|nr:ParA family protein [Gardnerella vaginalis]PNS43394.1 chromosome partitioning protein [Gardnerella vaginalis]